MKIRTRRILFIVFTICFICVGAVTALYASGYVFDFSSFEFRRTGAIFLDFYPEPWTGFLNDRLIENEPRLLGGGIFLRDLAPDNYTVRVEKPGYISWSKTLTVEPALVAAASNLILFPEHISSETIYDELYVDAFWDVPSGLIFRTSEQDLYFYANDIYEKIRGVDVVAIGADGYQLITRDKQNEYRLYDVRDLTSSLNLSAVYERLSAESQKITTQDGILDYEPHPFDTDQWLVRTKNALYELDAEALTLQTIATGTLYAIATSDENIFYASDDGIYRYDLVRATHRHLLDTRDTTFSLITTIGDSEAIALDTQGNLIFIGREEVRTIAHDAVTFTLSPGADKIAFLDTDHSLHIYHLKDTYGLYERRKGEVLHVRDIPFIADTLAWYSNTQYLLIGSDGDLAHMLELDDNDATLSYSLPSHKTLHYDGAERAFHYLENGNIYTFSLEE